LFRGKDVEKSVGTLSGGERARLALAKLLVSEPTWLAMDEPTNHIDLAGRTALEEMLSEFSGALVCVSHDRAFLDSLCDRIIEVSRGQVREFRGNYTEFRTTQLAEAEEAGAAKRENEKRSKKAQEVERVRKEKSNGNKSSKNTKSAKSSKKNQNKNPWKLKKVEARIIELEGELGKLRESLGSEEIYRDQALAREVQFKISEFERELEEANAEWEQWAT